MTYGKIYNELNKAGLIEIILSKTNNDKIGVIKGIQYLADFLNSHAFNNMKYWTEHNANKTICITAVEYAKLKMENINKNIEKYNYMATTMTV